MSCVLGLEVNLPAASGSDPALMGDMPMKKKILYIAAIVICLSLITGGTYAYFTTSDTARNVITSGGIEVNVVEQQLVNGTLQPYLGQPIPVMPATTVSKIVSVHNTEQVAWVRMNYTLTVYDADGKKMDIPADELTKVIVIAPDATNWTQKDGWWYYNTAIASGETTKPLFEEVVFSGPYMDNKYQLCTMVIDVTAQAVQQANNGSVVLDALGWPES